MTERRDIRRRRRIVRIDTKPLVQLERLYDELLPPPAPRTVELAEVAPGAFAMAKPGTRRNPRRPRLSEIVDSINTFGDELERQLGEAFEKAFK
jgi:hypothetical protein